MEALKKRRKAIKCFFSRVETLLNSATSETVELEQIEARLDKIESSFADYEAVQGDIELDVDDEKELKQEFDGRAEVEERYILLKAKCRRLIKEKTAESDRYKVAQGNVDNPLETSFQKLAENQASLSSLVQQLVNINSNNSTPVNNTNNVNSSSNTGGIDSSTDNLKLPRIEIPQFNGDYLEWISFRDLFVTLVHDNLHLKPVQKLQYLKSALKGDAASAIRHLVISDANYNEAWEQVMLKYNKEKFIIDAHLKTIMDQSGLREASLQGLKRIYNTVTESVRALRALKEPVDSWNSWLIYVVVQKLDPESRQLWARNTATNDSPTFKELAEFIANRQCELTALVSSHNTTQRELRRAVHSCSVNACPKCNGSHELRHCAQFKILSLPERKTLVIERKLCFLCLNSGHNAFKCRASTCSKCHRGRHHTMLHQSSPKVDIDNSSTSEKVSRSSQEVTQPQNLVHTHLACNGYGQAILPTALVYVGERQDSHLCRALLDSGSQATLITEACVNRFGLQRKYARVTVNGVGSTVMKRCRGMVNIKLSGPTGSCVDTWALVLTNITCHLPQRRLEENEFEQFDGLELADPQFNKPAQIDILIGADIFFDVILNGKVRSKISQSIAINTIFGWVISGKSVDNQNKQIMSFQTTTDITDQLLQRFWELEELAEAQTLTEEEQLIESHYVKTHTRRDDGRYVVRLPFKQNSINLASTQKIAESRLRAMEGKFKTNDNFRAQYHEFMREYVKLGHMRKCNTNVDHAYYLPHHAVLKPDSSTTKLRVVFDASCRSSNGASLNDRLMTGPVIQSDLADIIIRFRTHKVAIMADITKMYRQILIDDRDVKYQRILWRWNDFQSMDEYELLTITYGTTPASFQATRTLCQLASDDGHLFPLAAKSLVRDFYMDDLLSGSEDEEAACILMDQLIQLLHRGGFELRKWSSNSEKVLRNIPLEEREYSVQFSTKSDITVKSLGLHWQPAQDCFMFKVKLLKIEKHTKRTLLSEVARVFDPLGWLAPCIVGAKIWFQSLWLLSMSWDDELPAELNKKWIEFRIQLAVLENIKIPRLMKGSIGVMELHGFCDASEKAYSAVVYLRTGTIGNRCIQLVAAKTRVAPLKQISLPRLELCGAVLLAKLLAKLRDILGINDSSCAAWTDSTIVLSWLAKPPREWKTFVANRTSTIMNALPRVKWAHVSSNENPADCASRGISPSELLQHKLWWNGPDFLYQENQQTEAAIIPTEVYDGEMCTLNVVTKDIELPELLLRFSTFTRLVRITAWCMRFMKNSRVKKPSRLIGNLSSKEIINARNIWIRHAQQRDFADEIEACKKNHSLLRRSKLENLNPFLDSDHLLRVGGRVQNADLEFSQRHPIILPSKHPLTELIIAYFHKNYLHAGPTLLISTIQQEFWIPRCRELARKIVRKCLICTRYRAVTNHQQMGNLPVQRLQPGRAFQNTGVDYAGPFRVRSWKGRGAKVYKSYVVLFVCMATRAVHLELATDLSTDSFLAAFRRFCARRGSCSRVFSDNGTNFVGARRQMAELCGFLKSAGYKEKMSRFFSDHHIEWSFIPPASPNFGGLWEAGVKAVKFHLRRVLGEALLTLEEFGTLLSQIEFCLNSRPLCARPIEEAGVEALTPGHFIVGGPMTSLPEKSIEQGKISLLSRWQLVQQLYQGFWKRWQKEYVSNLQQRYKWRFPIENLASGDLVIIKEDNMPPGKWALGRIQEVHPGKDGLVRVATIKTAASIIKRPTSKLCVLPVNSSGIEEGFKAGGMSTHNLSGSTSILDEGGLKSSCDSSSF